MEISMNFEVRENFSDSINASKQTPKSSNNDFKNVINKNKSNLESEKKGGLSEENTGEVNSSEINAGDADTGEVNAENSNEGIEKNVLTVYKRLLSRPEIKTVDDELLLTNDSQDEDEVLLEDLTEKIVEILEGFGLLNEQKGEIKLNKETLDYIFSGVDKDVLDGNEKMNNLVFGELAGTQKVSPNEINQELKELVLQYLSSLENSNDEVKTFNIQVSVENGEVKKNDGQVKSVTYQGKEIDLGKLNDMVQKAVKQSTGNGQSKSNDTDMMNSQPQNIDLADGIKQDSNQVQKSGSLFSETFNAQSNVSSEDMSENITKIVSRMSSHIADGKSEFDVELKPEFLGKVSIKLISENGEMKALIKAGNNETRAMIADQLSMLNDTLKDKGINISSVDVVYDSATLDMSDQNFLNQQNEQNNGKSSGNRRARQNGIESLSYDILPEIEAPEISVRNSSVEFTA